MECLYLKIWDQNYRLLKIGLWKLYYNLKIIRPQESAKLGLWWATYAVRLHSPVLLVGFNKELTELLLAPITLLLVLSILKEEEISGPDILALTRWSMIKRIRSSTVIENVAPHPLNKIQQGHLLLNTEWTNYFIIKIYLQLIESRVKLQQGLSQTKKKSKA